MAPPHHYVEPPDCPEGMTLAAWRAQRTQRPVRRGLLRRLRPARQVRPVVDAASAPTARAA